MLKHKMFVAIFIISLTLTLVINKIDEGLDWGIMGLVLMAPFALGSVWIILRASNAKS